MNIEELLPILSIFFIWFKTFVYILTFIIIITYTLSLWFIFKKEDIKELYSLIPFYNFYKIFQLVKIPFYTIFIPLVNAVVIILLPYKLLKRYKMPRWMMNMSVFFPYVFMPYIAFSDKCQKPKDMKKSIKTLFELENIENNLENNLDIDDLAYKEELSIEDDDKNKNFTSKTEEMIENIEKNSIVDDYYFENEVVNVELENKKGPNDIQILDSDVDDIVEIFDQEGNSLSSSTIDTIDEQLKNNENIVRVDNAKYEQYKQREESNESIAFGGTKKEEDATHSKNSELICVRCGSSLVGASDFCPGCGLKIS